MPKTFKNLKELMKSIQIEIDKSLSEDVSKKVKKVQLEHVKKDVYDKYEPTVYNRRKDNGGLSDIDNIEGKLIKSGLLSIENKRKDEETGRLVAPVVETGQGYNYDFPFNGKSRPFVKNTIQELEVTQEHVQALKEGLQKRGINTK